MGELSVRNRVIRAKDSASPPSLPIEILIYHPHTFAPSELAQEIKTGSSKWLKTRAARDADFPWQIGYGIFPSAPKHRPALEQFIGPRPSGKQSPCFRWHAKAQGGRGNLDFAIAGW